MAKQEAEGRVVRREKNGKTKVIRTARGKRWSQVAERVFLEELAATGNVRASAAKAGFSTTAIYRRRMQWPGFATEWQACLDQGIARIEMQLIELATDSLRSEAIRGDGPAPALSVADALNLLKLHRAAVFGGPAQRYGMAQAKAPDMEKVRASILRKIEAIERAEARAARGEGA